MSAIQLQHRNCIHKFDVSSINIATFCILPFCEVNCNVFGGISNFKNCYLAKDNKGRWYCMVEIYNCDYAGDRPYKAHTYFVYDYTEKIEDDFVTTICYRVPKQWYKDCEIFKKGKYSKMSQDAKIRIYLDSGLIYKKPIKHNGETVYVTNVLLMSIAKEDMRKRMLEAQIGEKLDSDSELFSLPSEREFQQVHPDSYLNTIKDL